MPANPDNPTPPPDTRDALLFLTRMAGALGAHGAAAHRLEDALSACARRLGVHAEFFATPTGVFVTVGDLDNQRTRITPIESFEVNIEKLTLLDRTLTDTAEGAIDVREGLAQIERILAAPPRFGPVVTTASFAAISASATVFFKGSVADAATAGVIGLVVGALASFASRDRSLARVLEFVSGAAAAIIATFAALITGGAADPATAMLAGLIVLVPGLTLTTAVNELATRHLVSGSARLMGALIVFVMIGFGVAVGLRIGALLPVEPGAVAAHFPDWFDPVALLITAFPLVVLFRTGPNQILWVLLAALIGYSGARLGAITLGPGLGACIGAFLVGATSNACARILNRPAAVMTAPGILLLVPGSIGFRSVASLLNHDVIAGVETAFGMLMVAAAIVTGLLLANVVVPPRRAL
ncbi:MAG: threonine/serine exporter family protein [Phycisphaeraceae bacterium]|nr:threonine/serine exporter family protein [Phycisphaeraceae bacterium]MCB9848079.1 threonine/serine exporter family protein [Phycisphaeraceae bacterium]